MYAFDREGVRAQTFAGAAKVMVEQKEPVDYVSVQQLLDRYVGAWSQADPVGAAALYRPDASLRDSLLGVALDGAAAIGAAAGSTPAGGGLRGVSLRTIRDDRGPAYYMLGKGIYGGGPVYQLVLLLSQGEAAGCPGPVAVVLQLSDYRIVAEQRYHRIDAVRRCADPAALPGGWWDDITVPPSDSVVRTGTVTVRGMDVAVWNGTAGLNRLVAWGLGRFADVPLALPPGYPSSVTFLPPGDDCAARFGFGHGVFAGDIAVCAEAVRACVGTSCGTWRPWVKAALLHQYAHAWLDTTLTSDAKAAYLARTGLAWSDPTRPFAAQASERAAETLVWGLMDQPYRVDVRLGQPSCEQLSRDFRLLTGLDPLGGSCADRAR